MTQKKLAPKVVEVEGIDVALYTLHRASQIKVEAGAKVASATGTRRRGQPRNELEFDLRRAVITAYVTEFGEIKWDIVQFIIVHTNTTITVEIAVSDNPEVSVRSAREADGP